MRGIQRYVIKQLIEEGKEIRVDDIESAVCFALLDDARDVDFAGSCAWISIGALTIFR
jgi:hypothetical protein